VDLLYNYNILMELIVDGQGIVFYKVPQGTTLFRGDSDKYLYQQQVMRLQDRPTFFGLDQENVEENYGIAYKFITLVELNLIALDNNKGRPFYDTLPIKYKQILDVNYGYKTGTRDSESEMDKQLLEYLCENGYDGYACGPMPTSTGVFHAEVVLCKPADKLSGGQCVTDPKTAEQKIYDLNMRQFAPVKQKREPLRRMESPPRNLFGSQMSPRMNMGLFGSPASPPAAKGLFGGPMTPPAARGLFDTPQPDAKGLFGSLESPPVARRFSPPGTRGLFSTEEDKENTRFFGGRRKSTFKKRGAKTKRKQKKRRTQRNRKTKK
jgi:hypothetical protein